MDNIVEFPTKEGEHLSGMAKCIMCRHEWAAVAPIGVTWMECPACNTMNGRYLAHIEKLGEHWHCKCGNDLFYIQPTRTYCPRCGVDCVFT